MALLESIHQAQPGLHFRDDMKKILSLVLLLLVLESCVAKEMDFDVFDNKGATSPICTK